ncbi:CRISPR-associated endoribonuclease Cas6 [Arcobacter sp. s6]|uniref:CRISPR-associated endoribonuclease Cas6 n=1 Tax=Arcobacter sp. s6 TaxID=3230363 RepID=UPI00349FF11C
MKIFELKCKAYLKTNIELKNSFDVLSKYLNYSIYQNEIYKNKDTSIKNYCFGNFYPTESDKIYKKNNVYEFVIRSIDEEFIDELEIAIIENMNNGFLLVLSAIKKEIDQFFIRELYTATPVIVSEKKDDTGRQIYWSLDYNGDIEILQNQLQKNLEKKLKLFFPENKAIIDNFIDEIEIKNLKPQSIYFKTIKNQKEKLVRLIGNKFKIVPKKDDLSQKLAFLSLGVGLGEKSSFGGGFCLGRGA